MKLKCSCRGIAFATRRKFVYQGEADRCRSRKQPGHIAITDVYQDDAVANWHLDAECSGGQTCGEIQPMRPANQKGE